MALPTLPGSLKRKSTKTKAKKQDTYPLAFRFKPETRQQLQDLADHTHLSQAAVIAILIAQEHGRMMGKKK
jgi:hypothetical protein